MSPPTPPKTLEQRVTDLEATDRRHSKQVRAVREGVDETKRAVTNHGETSRDELAGAVRILSSALGDMAVVNEQRHAELQRQRAEDRAEATRQREALERELEALKSVPKHTAAAALEASRAKAVTSIVAQDTTDILARQRADRRASWVRMVLTIASLPILQQVFAALLRHC